MPGLRQFARELRARAIGRRVAGFAAISRAAIQGEATSVATLSTSQIATMLNSAALCTRSAGIATSASGTRKNSEMPQSVFM